MHHLLITKKIQLRMTSSQNTYGELLEDNTPKENINLVDEILSDAASKMGSIQCYRNVSIEKVWPHSSYDHNKWRSYELTVERTDERVDEEFTLDAGIARTPEGGKCLKTDFYSQVPHEIMEHLSESISYVLEETP